MIISIDFDGTICKRTGIPRSPGIYDQEPQENALDAIKWLISKGHDLYIQTNRNPNEVEFWLKEHNFPLLEITDYKKKGTSIYLDDRAVRFVSWMDFCKYLG